jgi:hypothetical protein
MVRFGRIVLERRFHETHGLMDGDRRQLNAVGDIADSPDIADIGTGVTIDDDLCRLPRRRPQAKTFGIGLAAESQHDLIDHANAAIGQMAFQPAVRPFHHLALHGLAENVDALLLHRFMQEPLNHGRSGSEFPRRRQV